MIEVTIAKTCKFSARGEWQRYDDTRKSFADMTAAREWLSAEYGKAQRRAMYRDMPNGKTIKCGYVIGFKIPYRSKGDALYEQHWVGFNECKPVEL